MPHTQHTHTAHAGPAPSPVITASIESKAKANSPQPKVECTTSLSVVSCCFVGDTCEGTQTNNSLSTFKPTSFYFGFAQSDADIDIIHIGSSNEDSMDSSSLVEKLMMWLSSNSTLNQGIRPPAGACSVVCLCHVFCAFIFAQFVDYYVCVFECVCMC